MISLMEPNNGGQANPDQETNIEIPEEQYVASRSYLALEGSGNQFSLFLAFVVYMAFFGFTVLYFFKIMHTHFIFYLLEDQQKIDDRLNPPANADAGQREMILKYSAPEDDACGCCRWNHILCVHCCLCRGCSKKKDKVYTDYKKDVYEVFMDNVAKSCDIDAQEV